MFEIPGKRVAVKFYGRTRCSGPDDRTPAQRKKVEARVAPTFVLKYNIRTRSLADQGAIEDVLAVERCCPS